MPEVSPSGVIARVVRDTPLGTLAAIALPGWLAATALPGLAMAIAVFMILNQLRIANDIVTVSTRR
jgi:predicted lipid-binding transport protein (Tim44 family)